MHPSPVHILPLRGISCCRFNNTVKHHSNKWITHDCPPRLKNLTFKSNITSLYNISLRTLNKVHISSLHGQSQIPVLQQTKSTSLQIVNKHINFAKRASTTPDDQRNIAPQAQPPNFQIDPYMKLSRFDRPIGTWLLLWPCYWSIAMATPHGALPDPVLLTLFGIGAVVMRGAGCTYNDWVDTDIDKKVTRTKTRPLASGKLTSKQAIAFLALQLSLGLAVLLSLNYYSIVLGASSLIFVGIYPFMKRVTYWPQFVLGLAFNWGALLGYSAVAGHCDWQIALPLYLSGIAWTLVYDTIYAHQDKTDDVIAGVKSTALLFGEKTKPILSAFSALCIGSLALSGILAEKAWPFYLGTALGAAQLAWQIYKVDLNNREDCMNKFISNKYYGAIITAGIVLSNLV